MFRFWIVTVFFISSIPSVYGLDGSLFHLTCLRNDGDYLQEIFVISSSNGYVTIEYNFPLNNTETIQLNSENDWKYVRRIRAKDMCPPFNTITNAAIVISSTMDISVQVNNAGSASVDGYLGLPLTTSSTRFYLASYSATGSYPTEFSIISPYSDTSVIVANVRGSTSNEILKLTMSENDVYHSGSLGSADYTGLFVTSSKPIAVFSGHLCAYVPAGSSSCDHLVEQMPPVSQWGKTFIMAPFYGRPKSVGFIFRVIAQDYTVVTYWQQTYDSSKKPIQFTLVSTVTLNRGQWHETTVNTFAVVLINCTTDCLVMQYSKSHMTDDNAYNWAPDSFMVTVPSLNHYTNNIKFSTSRWLPDENIVKECINGITIVAESSVFEKLYLDSDKISNIAGIQYRINASAWSSYTVGIAPLTRFGFHSVTSEDPREKFAVFVYGHKSVNVSIGPTSYGYLGGYGYIYGANDQAITSPYYKRCPTQVANESKAAVSEFPNRNIDESSSVTTLWVFLGVSIFSILLLSILSGVLVYKLRTAKNALACTESYVQPIRSPGDHVYQGVRHDRKKDEILYEEVGL